MLVSKLCLLTTIHYRALLQLQPDIIVAKLSQVHISTTAHSLESPHFSLPQTSNLDGPLDEPVNSGAVISQGRTKDEYSWTMSSLLGTVGYSKSRYSVIKRRHTDDAGRKEEREEIIALYRSPTWLVNRAWRIQATKACFGWTFSPRTYNVIPPTSPVFRYVRNDDVRGLQDLFSNRLASPSDCDERGETLLHVRITFSLMKDSLKLNVLVCCVVLQPFCMQATG